MLLWVSGVCTGCGACGYALALTLLPMPQVNLPVGVIVQEGQEHRAARRTLIFIK